LTFPLRPQAALLHFMVPILSSKLWFPGPGTAQEDGLLAVGGDLSPERLLLAYRSGIFPWFNDDELILWFSPHQRFVLFPGHLRISSSMEQIMRSGKFRVTVNQDFRSVIVNCAGVKRKGQGGTWITKGMINAYLRLHKLGHAHSVEVWQNEKLAGGLYGVAVGRVFCGESMFSLVSNASKMALIHVAGELPYALIDCQVYTPHLASLGAEFISRKAYEKYLRQE
jgi:leucyl/phenylalanyl-tRNA--protein transferase